MRALYLPFLLLAACAAAPPAGPLEVVPAMYLGDGQLVEVNDGDAIRLEFPPQGGHVLFVGATARHLEGGVASVRGRLRTLDEKIVNEEERHCAFDEDPDDPTQVRTVPEDHYNVANVPVCPAYTKFDLFGHAFILEVTVTEESGRTATARRQVVPSCLQSDEQAAAYCRCTCAANYVLGACQ